jgi:AcrR family transcriptional regulator
VLGAAIQLLTERGIDAATMNEVVARSGVARATVYLRWPNRQALMAAAVRRAMGQPVLQPTGDVQADVGRAAEQIRAILASPDFRGVFPALVAALTRAKPEALSFEVVAPGRALFVREYDELAAEQGLAGEVTGATVADLIVGAAIAHYLTTGEAPTEAVRDEIVAVVLDGVRRGAAPEAVIRR